MLGRGAVVGAHDRAQFFSQRRRLIAEGGRFLHLNRDGDLPILHAAPVFDLRQVDEQVESCARLAISSCVSATGS